MCCNRKEDSRVFPYDRELDAANLVHFRVSQFAVKRRVAWLTGLCRDAACWTQAHGRIVFQLAVVDFHRQVLRGRLLRSQGDHQSILLQLSKWDEERRFYQHLNSTVLNTQRDSQLKEQQQQQRDRHYSDGIRFG